MRWQGEGYRTRRLEALLERRHPRRGGRRDRGVRRRTSSGCARSGRGRRARPARPRGTPCSATRTAWRRREAAAATVQAGVGAAPRPLGGVYASRRSSWGRRTRWPCARRTRCSTQPGSATTRSSSTGPSGVGKTHLLARDRQRARRRRGRRRRRLLLHPGVHRRAHRRHRRRPGRLVARALPAAPTALLLDDVQLLAGKERTQEELFNLFNLLHDGERQLVFTPPAHPSTLVGVEQRLGSRLEGGLVVELAAPDRDVRRAVLDRLLAQHERRVPTPRCATTSPTARWIRSAAVRRGAARDERRGGRRIEPLSVAARARSPGGTARRVRARNGRPPHQRSDRVEPGGSAAARRSCGTGPTSPTG